MKGQDPRSPSDNRVVYWKDFLKEKSEGVKTVPTGRAHRS